MNYLKVYNNIIDRSRNRQLFGYVENHHIIPKCAGGTDENWNLTPLTAREHFVCHMLLCEIYPKNIKLKFALWNMCNVKRVCQKRYIVSSKVYERIRIEYSNSVKGENSPNFGRKFFHTDETKYKISKSRIGKFTGDKNPFFRKKHTKETIDIIKEKRAKQKFSEESRLKMSIARKGKSSGRKGKINSEEHRKKIKESLAKISHPKPSSKKCKIDNMVFESGVEAAKFFKIPDSTVRDRLRNDNFKNWTWIITKK